MMKIYLSYIVFNYAILGFRCMIPSPLWRYVTKEAKLGKGGGNVAFQCNFCIQIYRGSYYRVKAHLLKIKGAGVASCTKVMNENLVEMRRVMEEAEQTVKQSNLK